MVHLLLPVIYLAFISLGLPDAILGAAWPSMYPQLGVPVSWAGAVSLIISAGTVVSSLCSDRLTRRWGAGRVTAASVAMTAASLAGFSLSGSFWQLCLWAVPYGLGAGSVDAALNNYVALHYASRHMSWLHCMWGIGASLGPYLMGRALTGAGWSAGYRQIALLQAGLTAVVIMSLPLWKRQADGAEDRRSALPLREVLSIPGARATALTFFCYCGLESTAGLWASSYLVLHGGLPEETAARYASLFFLGITAGRAASGFLTLRLRDGQMVRLGQAVTALGGAMVLLGAAPAGLVCMGLGCAPIYPSLIHATPERFGPERSQAVIGVEMACAYMGTSLMPPLFGALSARLGMGLFPLFLLTLLAVMALAHGAKGPARAKGEPAL